MSDEIFSHDPEHYDELTLKELEKALADAIVKYRPKKNDISGSVNHDTSVPSSEGVPGNSPGPSQIVDTLPWKDE